MERLKQAFFARSARVVARDMLGRHVVRLDDGVRISGIVVETEAYCDPTPAGPDRACHAVVNQGRPTARTEVMFGPPGHAYVYLCYGIHWLLNIVTAREGVPNAVLIRALEPLEGESVMAQRRQRPPQEWTNGPGKLTAALAIDGTFHGTTLFDRDGKLWIETGQPVPDSIVETGPRIGLGKTAEPWLSLPWRYWIRGNSFVSR